VCGTCRLGRHCNVLIECHILQVCPDENVTQGVPNHAVSVKTISRKGVRARTSFPHTSVVLLYVRCNCCLRLSSLSTPVPYDVWTPQSTACPATVYISCVVSIITERFCNAMQCIASVFRSSAGSVPAELRCGAVRCIASCRVTELWKPRVIRHVRTRHGNTLDSIKMFQRSYSTLGPVSAWVGDRLWTGKPPRRRTRYPGLLSLSPLCVVKLE